MALLKRIWTLDGNRKEFVILLPLNTGNICEVSVNKSLCGGLKGHAAAVNYTWTFSRNLLIMHSDYVLKTADACIFFLLPHSSMLVNAFN